MEGKKKEKLDVQKHFQTVKAEFERLIFQN